MFLSELVQATTWHLSFRTYIIQHLYHYLYAIPTRKRVSHKSNSNSSMFLPRASVPRHTSLYKEAFSTIALTQVCLNGHNPNQTIYRSLIGQRHLQDHILGLKFAFQTKILLDAKVFNLKSYCAVEFIIKKIKYCSNCLTYRYSQQINLIRIINVLSCNQQYFIMGFNQLLIHVLVKQNEQIVYFQHHPKQAIQNKPLKLFFSQSYYFFDWIFTFPGLHITLFLILHVDKIYLPILNLLSKQQIQLKDYFISSQTSLILSDKNDNPKCKTFF